MLLFTKRIGETKGHPNFAKANIAIEISVQILPTSQTGILNCPRTIVYGLKLHRQNVNLKWASNFPDISDLDTSFEARL